MKEYIIEVFDGMATTKYIIKALSKGNAKTRIIAHCMASLGKKVKVTNIIENKG